ncbi:MAG TPA: hypothetical protein VJ770_18880 [Stellaceae bacterium]|nr:hypothetical protein [Stellaceae bacterium]
MLNRFVICAALVVLGAGSSAAQEREATLHKIEVPGASFEMLVATAKSPDAPVFGLGDTPDAFVIHLIGGKLWVGFEDAGKMIETIKLLRQPIGSFHMERTEADPIAVYFIPKVGDRISQ